MSITSLPRVPLAFLPTPLEAAERLTEYLGGPVILIKRDDMTGLALGGNKARKLEFLLGAAKAQASTIVMTTAGANSNYLRMCAAGARKAGMRPILFMRGSGQEPITGNLLLNEIVGAELRFIPTTDPWSSGAGEIMAEAAHELEREGERVSTFSIQTTDAPLAAMGYVKAALELHQQVLDQGHNPNYIFTTTGSGVTHAGLILGAKLLRWPVQVVGIAGSPGDPNKHRERIADIVERGAHLLGVPMKMRSEDVIVVSEFAGERYAALTPGVVNAIRTVGETEGIILDQVYNGKSMHGLMDWISNGQISSTDSVIFLHTGGAPNLFANAEALGTALQNLREGARDVANRQR